MKRKRLLAGILSVILAINSNVLTVLAAGGEEDLPQPPSRSVTITASSETPASEEEVTLTAAGCEDADSLQWQEMEETAWTDIEGETSGTYTFTWTEELETASFRLAASWEGEDESVETVYSDALTLTAAAEEPADEPEDPDGEPDNPDGEPDNPDGEPENPDGEPENPDGEPDANSDPDRSTRDGDGDTGTTFASFQDAAEAYYGENGSQRVGEATVSMTAGTGSVIGTNGEIKAGSNLSLVLGYTLDAAPLFEYAGSAQAETLFDTYENTKLVLTLPEGLTVTTEAEELSGVERIEKADGQNVWTLVLSDEIAAQSSSNGSFTLNVLVEGNGKIGIGKPFNFGNGADLLKLETEFTILDKSNGDSKPSELKYNKTIETASTLTNLVSATDDQWGIEKTAGTATPSSNKSTVTVTFKLAVGLLDTNNQVSPNPSTYSRYGRVPFESITLTETPEVLDRQDNEITAESITITPDFDSQSAITVTKGEKITLPVDTCEDKYTNPTDAARVDSDAPYYSTYTVTIVYPYEKFIAKYSDANQEKLDVKNTAEIDYTLKGGTEQNDSAEATVSAGEVTSPAAITISKYIVGAGGAAELYSSANFPSGDPVSGEVKFTITKQEDGTAPKLYEKSEDGTYQEMTGANGIVTLSNSGSGSVTVYLDPGTYTVTETAQPDHTAAVTEAEDATNNAADKTVTVAAGETGTADFYNRETLGSITIEKKGKKDGTESPLAGAVFGLYSNAACTDGDKLDDAITDSNGTITFSRLPYETYWVKEISAPSGYRIDDAAAKSVTLDATDMTETLEFTNTYNEASVRLEKKIYDLASNTYVTVDKTNYSEEFTALQKAFTLEKKVGDNNWETVDNTINLGENGTTEAIALPVYDGNGQAITYRFAEKLPEGFHGASGNDVTDSNGVRWAYSDSFTLVAELGKGESEAKKIIMKNTRNGSITVTKQFYDATAAGMKESTTQKEATFDLYYKDGDGAFQKYNSTSYTTDSSGNLTITDLPTSGASGARSYYLVEQGIAGYKLTDDVQSGDGFAYSFTTQINGQPAVGPFTFTEERSGGKLDLSRAVTLTNVEQKVPVIVKKEDFYTGDFVKGAKYKIYEWREDGTYTETDLVLGGTDGIEVPDQNGSFQKLDPGKKYIVFETTVPEKYTNEQPNGIVIDLMKIDTVEYNTSAETITLKNRPDPKLTITKYLIGADGSSEVETVGAAEFEVYTLKSGTADEFVPFHAYGSNDVLTVENEKAVQLPAGTYYLKETTLPGNVLDPKDYHDLYEAASSTTTGQGFKGVYVANDDEGKGAYYFGPITVTDGTNGNFGYVINNYAATGAVKVKKLKAVVDGGMATLSGATIAVYRQGEAEPVKTAVSGSDGTATFSNLPIFDENGNKITYVIKETAAPDDYTVSDQEFTVTLKPGVTVLKDVNDKELTIVNQPKVSFHVSKVYYNLWEHQFTQKEYLLPGTEIALYRWDADHENAEGQAKGAYVYEEVATTNELGEVTFEGLNQKDEYVAIEVSIPDVEGFEYLEPADLKIYLEYGEDGKLPQTIKKDDLDTKTQTGHDGRGYNYVTKEANNGSPVASVKGKLVNVENWTQLQIEKYVYKTDADKEADNKSPVNNAVFQLYMEVLPENTANDAKLSFDQNDLGKYTLVGTYSSGTLYDENGVRQDGWFATDILKSADEVVYWLVEIEPGIGTAIIPDNAVTLIKRNDTKYTNNTTYTYTDSTGEREEHCTNSFNYVNNQVAKEDIENAPLTGEGAAQYTTVRIAKWAGSYNEDGTQVKEYTPLGNAVFELWLVDENGGKLVQLDTLTTGLDNDLSNPDNNKDLTAWASSRAFSLQGLLNSYEGENKISYVKDNAGNTYVRAALVESGAPAGYQTSTDMYYLYLFFKKPEENKTTEIFNDVFYVKGKDEEVTVADQNDPIQFSLYPTEETDASAGAYTLVSLDDVTGKPDNTTGQLRLVNWPTDNFAVTVRKFGYEVNSSTVNKTSAQLNEYFSGIHSNDREPLTVTMKLQRWYNGEQKWEDYTYPNGASASFTTTNGYFAFPNGLPIGRYRIIETDPDPAYENIYTGAAVTPEQGSINNAEAYYFSVTRENVDLTLYNPKKLELTIEKKSLDGKTSIDGASFSLKTGNSTQTKTTASGGTATFTDLASGIYVLSETSAGTGYSNAYFADWFKEEYKDEKATIGSEEKPLADFVSSGIFLGFKTELQGGEMIVTEKKDLSSYGITGSPLALTVKNPPTVSLTVEKQDAQTPATKLPGAEFTVEYTPFTAVDDTAVSITSSTAKWTDKRTITTAETTGQATASGLTPGIYRVKETKAPDGYDITDSSYQYIALTGGLDVGTVKVKEKASDGTEKEIPVTNYGTDNATAPLVFEDTKHVSLTVTKTLDTGSLGETDAQDDNYLFDKKYTFTFTLYAADKKLIETKSIELQEEKDSEGGIIGYKLDADAKSVTFSGLSQGGMYYLKEGHGVDFDLEGISQNGTALTADTDGYYTITVPNNGTNVSVTATNVYLFAEVSVRKVKGDDGKDLTGADFEVYKVVNGIERRPAVNEEFTETSTGVYTARVPVAAGGGTFHIKEANAPYGYVLDRDQFAEVTLQPGDKLALPVDWNRTKHTTDQAMLADRIFPNYPGAVITITKYGGNRGDENAQPLKDVSFTLYRKDGGSWLYSMDGQTDEDGKVTFTVAGDTEYAVRETSTPTGYAGLQGLWSDDGTKAEEIQTSVGVNMQLVTLYKIGSGNLGVDEYTYDAYNTPYVALEIRKQLVDPSSSATIPTATVNVYQVENGTKETLTQAEVQALMTSSLPVSSNVSVDQNKQNYSSSGDLPNVIMAGSSYLFVETESSVPQLRDNKDVVWYKVLHVASDERDKQTVTLKNLDANVDIQLTKTTTASNLTSLFESDAIIEYTLKPTVTNSYPLTSLTITDDGLTAHHIPKKGDGTPTGDSEVELSFDTYLKDKYSITSVTVPTASHETGNYADDDSAKYPIDATVTFYDFNGTEIYSAIVDADAEGAARTVILPANKGKAKTLSVSYASSAFEAATGYALGQNVTLSGDIQLTVHLEQQTATGETVQAISRIENKAKAVAKYKPWGKDGALAAAESEVEDESDAAAVTFQMRKAAIVSVTKTASSGTVSLRGEVTYTITISNAQNATAPMQAPFLVDFLPQGSSLASTEEEIESSIAVTGNDDNASTITYSHMRTQTASGETGVFVFLDGNLAPGDSVSVRLKVKAEDAVAAYGTEMKNYVIVGSDVAGYKTDDNKCGASFMNSNNAWAGSVNSVLTTVDSRLDAFETILGERAAHGFISSFESVKWTSTSSVALVKSAYGDRNANDGYTTNLLSVVSNGGTMHYRLTISNTSPNAGLNNFSVVDLLPRVGDTVSGGTGRYSAWGLVFGVIENLYVVELAIDDSTQQTAVSEDDYKVYYYTGTGSDEEIYDAAATLKFNTTPLPDDWKTSITDAEKGDVKAFIVAVDPSVELDSAESLLIDYTATVNGGTDLDSDELSEISYTNAVNSFAVHCASAIGGTVSLLSLASNSVSNTILPDPVKVGGHIWIDKDADGKWEAGESIDNFQSSTLIRDMLEKVEVQLYTYRGSSTTSSGTNRYNQSTDTDWMEEANFVFGNLNAAALLEGLEPYGTAAYPNGILDPSKLKGTSPSTYMIGVTLPETIKGIFRVTQINEPVLYSRDPMELAAGEAFADEAFDNNYKASGTSNVSERFYLWAYDPAVVFDNTKDIGLVPYRTLEITKRADSENGDPLAGAEFAIYGPFEPGAATRPCTDTNRVGTYTTDANGKITVDNLLWYMDYVIVETKAPAEYTVSRAAATVESADTNLEKLSDGTWLLKTPADTKTDATDKITVVNRKKTSDPPTDPPKTPLPPPKYGAGVTFTPTVRKTVLGDARSEEATFRFLLTADKNNPSGGAAMSGTSVTVTGSGTASFGSIVFREPGNYLFYLREDTAQQAAGYTYDAAVWTLRISVAELGDDLILASTPVYEQGGTQRTGDAQFVNTYETPTEPPTEPPAEPPTTPDGGEPVPAADIPKTGDETGFLLWLTLLAVSGAGLAALGCRRFLVKRRIRRANPPQK